MAVAATVSLIAAGTSAAGAAPASSAGQQDTEYTVLLEDPGNREFAIDAVRAAGGEVVRDNKAIGLLTVKAPANGFVEKVSASNDIVGAARSKPIGHAPVASKAEKSAAKRDAVEKENKAAQANKA